MASGDERSPLARRTPPSCERTALAILIGRRPRRNRPIHRSDPLHARVQRRRSTRRALTTLERAAAKLHIVHDKSATANRSPRHNDAGFPPPRERRRPARRSFVCRCFVWRWSALSFVVPAKAGTQRSIRAKTLGSRLRGNDGACVTPVSRLRGNDGACVTRVSRQ